MTRYESGEGSGGKGLRVNIMHAWLPPSTQHQHGTTRTGLTQRISSGSPPNPNPFRNWTWLDWKFVFTVLHLNFGGFRFCGFRLSVVDCRLSVEFASPRTMLPSLLFATSAAACYAVLCRVFWPQIISIAIALRITLISSPFSWVPLLTAYSIVYHVYVCMIS